MIYRERRSWTEEEDQLLRDAVEREDPGTMNPSRWHAIAKHIPDRTNKDCRKRWFAKMASDVVKGGWSPEEDERLVQGIEKYGTKWSMVAAFVRTRNSDQCAKRWTDTLNPMIDRTTWSSEADALLIDAVKEHGKLWTKIARIYFPGRTGLAAKNRYNSITRFNNDSRTRRPSYRPRRKSGSVSSTSTSPSSSSASASPVTPAAQIPELPAELTYSPPGSAEETDLGSSNPLSWSSSDFKESDMDGLQLESLSYEEILSALLPPLGHADFDGSSFCNPDLSSSPLHMPLPPNSDSMSTFDMSGMSGMLVDAWQTSSYMPHPGGVFPDPLTQNLCSELFEEPMHSELFQQPVSTFPTSSIFDEIQIPTMSFDTVNPLPSDSLSASFPAIDSQFWSHTDINQSLQWPSIQ